MTYRSALIALICSFLTIPLFAQETPQKSLILKDGSIIHGRVLDDQEYKLIFITTNNDTLEYSYKLIKEVVDYQDLDPRALQNLSNPRYHKTEGLFVNADIYAFPISITVGQRINPSFLLGAQLSFMSAGNQSVDIWGITGIGPYARYYLSSNQNKTKGYIEGIAGVAFGRTSSNENNAKPFVGSSLGVQIPNRKWLRFYFEFGFYGIYNTKEVVISSSPVVLSKETKWNIFPSITLIGLQF